MSVELTLQERSKIITGTSNPVSRKLAFALVTALFFMWGFSHGLLDVLNHHFQETLNISRAKSGLVQTAYFGAYFVMALPVGAFMQRYGHKAGILLGLALFSLGSLLFLPASWSATFELFLGALFVLACGLACLEVSANLYAAALGNPETTVQRLNFAQSFNGFGVFLGPLLGGAVLYAPPLRIGTEIIAPTSVIYAALAVLVLLLMLVFTRISLPEIANTEQNKTTDKENSSLWARKNFTFALLAQFCNIGAYAGVGAFFINFCLEHWQGISAQYCSFLLSIAMVGYMIGRFFGTWLMRRIPARHLLLGNGLACAFLCVVAMMAVEKVSVLAVIAMYFFMSIMYPTIFGMGVAGLGEKTNKGGSILVMTLVGAAILPLVMGALADEFSIATSFIVPFLCYVVVALYALSQKSIGSSVSSSAAC
ncbi:sugar MFS transporter [Azomonas macrocytogenes]|uniref:FHS family L-fucose permease-like MFS transporter n=1 Tax=Azomonas macrocytogenes TaxID=69962 RepID=A0A839T6D8_AZOMA|nr:sugar MFS transporter [Azomonas macrocytogenes]MBB3105051.1 FHS family L-fucose permease-like MFS transporter [Azomonas macrocytogenes]